MKIEWKDAMNMISYTSFDKLDSFKKGADYKGSDIFSLIIPSDINTTGKVEIKKGHIISGQIKADQLGSKKQDSLIHMIYDQHGMDETKNFIDNTVRLATNFNLYNGFTVGIGDLYIPPELEQQMNKLFETKKLEVNHIITEMENNPDLYDPDTFEQSIYGDLNNIRETVSQLIMNNLTSDNKFNVLISSGAKGAPVNMGQMGGCVGQQVVEGRRIVKRVNGRTLPYFYQNDDSATGRGFVEEPFIFGMTPQSFIFHNMSSREGLIDTAIKSVTGDTPIIIFVDGASKRVLIGDWIDGLLSKDKDNVQHFEERDMELLELKNVVYIPTSDEHGNVSWGLIKNITRHDPGKELYKIKTLGGREVIVTESKSLLIWNDEIGEFVMTSTPDVKCGNYVPTTMYLPDPPIKYTHIDISKYLPKTEYMYGTDFICAKTELENVLDGRSHCPSGWWDENNGTTFCLPYEHAHRLRRVIKRSKITNIHENCVYPYMTRNSIAQIPDKLELNRDNGVFIGLFLAEGDANIKDGHVRISNNNKKIQEFVCNWFDKMSINYEKTSEINKIGGLSEGIRGFSRVLAKLITMLVGHGARHKRVPEEAFAAPNEFIIGLIDGYISGDGTITDNSIDVGSASKELIIGISMLLSRLGIFGKVSKTQIKSNNLGTKDIAATHTISIRGQWATKFVSVIKLTEDSKDIKIKNIVASDTHRNFAEHHDVVLDKIVSIELIDVNKYPKVYDLTVPSTLNFGLANGLHVVDTAESGYIQRKLIKSMEDAMVKYDNTLRNSNNTILQFTYGDNGIDTTKQSKHTFNLIMMGNKEIEEKYKFNNQELKNFPSFSSKDNDKYFKSILDMRDEMRHLIRSATISYIKMKDNFPLPADIRRIINNAKNSDLTSKEKLEPLYILKKLDDLMKHENTKLFAMSDKSAEKESSLKYKDEMESKTIFKFALHEFLSPKVTIFKNGLNKAQFDDVCDKIISSFNRSVIESGEMAGVIAAQSIGEPVTQIKVV